LDIDKQVLDFARGRARLKGITLGQAISELASAGISQLGADSSGATSPRTVRHPNGLVTFSPVPGHVITQELIDQVQDEMDEEEARVPRAS
jgi:hypothetical protein